MNKAITEGLELDPTPFEDGLGVWSRQDGTAGTDTYASAPTAAFVPADQDFAGCLEVLKTETTQRLRYMVRTPVSPGCYLRVRARVKVTGGTLPSVRVAATPLSGAAPIAGLTEAGPSVALTDYGRVYEVDAILGTGARTGVDLAWDERVDGAHVGLDLTGPSGGIVRIDDLSVEDVTGAFLRGMMDWVDVRDYGARGDGTTNDAAAFEAADRAAAGRTILVPAGTYHLDATVTLNHPVRFEGHVTMPVDRRLQLTRSFDLPSYIDAFGDEQEGLRRAIQALFNFTDHDTLDMMGRRVELTEPLDVQAAVFDKTTYANQRKIRNGQIHVQDSPAFDTVTVTEACSFDDADPDVLTDVAQVASIPVGSLVTAAQGVGREVYVKERDVAGGRLILSRPLWGAPASQTYTFKRFQYALDFSGFDNLQRFTLQDIELLLQDKASGILLPVNGLIFHVKDCFITGPRDRGLTSHGTGCQGLLLDRCQWLSNEQGRDVAERHTIGFNVNANDTKVRNNRAVKFKHWAVMSGSGHIVTGNHFFQGDGTTTRTAGIVFAEAQAKTVFIGNYVDNCYIEWTNEHDGHPDFASELSFGGLEIIGNILFSSSVAASYAPIHVKPFGSGHFLNGVTVVGNSFKTIKGSALSRVDFVDTTHADLDRGRYVDVGFHSNTFHAVSNQTQNPATLPVVQNSGATQWLADFSSVLPFGGEARVVQGITPEGRIKANDNSTVWTTPYGFGKAGAGGQSATITWSEPARGKVFVTARCDAPT